MPFDYVQYQQKVNTLSTEQLHKEWENYTRQIAGGATSTATSVLFSPVTGGVSLIGLGLSAPRIHNARKKREIIEAGLQARGATHKTRKRDVVAPMAVAGVISGLTLGLAAPGAEMIGGEVGAKGIEYVVAHAALDGTGAILEQKHDDHTKKKAEEKLHLQHQNFQKQNASMIGQQQAMSIPQGMYQIPGVSAPPGMVAMALQPGYQLIQDPRLGYISVPIPVPTPSTPVPQYRPITYQPVSNQQGFIQQPGPSMNPGQPAPQYQVQQTFQQPIHHSQQATPQSQNAGYPSVKQGETYPVRTESQQGFPPSFSEPLPVYSSTISTSTPASSENDNPQSQTMQAPQIMVNELPTGTQSVNVAQTPESAMEQEIALLKARLLQMELEKRNIAVEATTVLQQVAVEPVQSQSTSEISPQSSGGLGCSDHQAYRPSPSPTPQPTQATQHASSPVAITSVSPPIGTPPPQYDVALQNQQSTTPVLQHQIPSPPPSNQQQQQYSQQRTSLPPAPPIQNFSPQYQQQHIQPQVNIAVSQPQPQSQTKQPQIQIQQPNYIQTTATALKPIHPDFQRQDSGYYSQPPSRTQSVSSVPLYNPNLYQNQNQNQNQNAPPSPQMLTPQSTATSTSSSFYSPSQHRQSIGSVYTPSPSTPAPSTSNLYFPPPPLGTTNLPPVSPVGKVDYFDSQIGMSQMQGSRMSTPQPQTQVQVQGGVYRPDMYSSHPQVQGQYNGQQIAQSQGQGGMVMLQQYPQNTYMGQNMGQNQMQMNGQIQPQQQAQVQQQSQVQPHQQQQPQHQIQGTQGWQWGVGGGQQQQQQQQMQQQQFNQPIQGQHVQYVQQQQQQQQPPIPSGYPAQ